MKIAAKIGALLLGAMSATSYATTTAWGCDGVKSDADELHIYSGPYSYTPSHNRYLPDTYKFKAQESAFDSGWGSNLTWYLKKRDWQGEFNTVYSQTDTFDWDGTDNQYMNVGSRGEYCAVIKSSGYCNNRCFIVQNKPTADGSHEGVSGGYIEYNTSFQFYGDGDIDSYAKNNSLTYNWNFGDGTTSTSKNPSHVFDKAGTYAVNLKTYDGTFYSNSDTVAVLWVRGPAQPPRYINYEFGSCSGYTRNGFIDWERSGTEFEIQLYSSGRWLNWKTASAPATAFSSSTGGTNKIRLRAKDPAYGGPSAWKTFSFNVPSCGGSNPVQPF